MPQPEGLVKPLASVLFGDAGTLNGNSSKQTALRATGTMGAPGRLCRGSWSWTRDQILPPSSEPLPAHCRCPIGGRGVGDAATSVGPSVTLTRHPPLSTMEQHTSRNPFHTGHLTSLRSVPLHPELPHGRWSSHTRQVTDGAYTVPPLGRADGLLHLLSRLKKAGGSARGQGAKRRNPKKGLVTQRAHRGKEEGCENSSQR